MKRTNHHTFLLILAVTVTMLVAAVYGYMHYVVKVSITQAAAARDVVAIEKANRDRESGVQALDDRTATDRARLGTFFIPADRVVDFIEVIEALGPQTGSKVELSSIKEKAPGSIEGTPYGLAQAEVEAVGSWSAVMRTLSLVENFPYATTVSGVRLEASGNTGTAKKPSEWKATFHVEAVLSIASSSIAIPK